MPSPLAGLTVVDLSQGMPGALATMFLADYGADVYKIEPPDGDRLRGQPAFYTWYRGKRSVVLDLKTDAGQRAARDLALASDILVQNWRPGVAERMGLDYDSLAQDHPGLIYASITGMGPKGPGAQLKGYEGIVAAKMGALSQAGSLAPRPGPAFTAMPWGSYSAAQFALHGILAALYFREYTGQGQLVQATMAQGLCSPGESAGPFSLAAYLAEQYPEKYSIDPPSPENGAPIADFQFRLLIAMTKDGRWFQFAQSAPHLWKAFIKALDLEHTYDDPRLSKAPKLETYEDSVRFWDLLMTTIRSKTLDQWQKIFAADRNVGAELFRTMSEGLDHPQMRHNGQVRTVRDPRVGTCEQLAPWVRFLGEPDQPFVPAPDLGQHTDEALAHSKKARPLRRLSNEAPPAQALEGVTVIDIGFFYAAPFAATILAELGARVIKLEPTYGDYFRHMHKYPDVGGVKVMQGKESVSVDLETPLGLEVAHRLAKKVDIVLLNFREGEAKRMGLDHETLRAINPNLIFMNAQGYGLDGPYAGRPAFAPTITAALGGALLQAGPGATPDDPESISLDQVKEISSRLRTAASTPSNADGLSAQAAATAMLLGLVTRQRTGKAHDLMTSMIGSTAYALSADMIRYDGKPPSCGPDADLYGIGALYRLYPAKEGWVFLACVQEREWLALSRAIADATAGEVRLADDDRFATAEARVEHDEALAESIGGVLEGRTSGEWESFFIGYDVACCHVNETPMHHAVYYDPIMVENGFATEVEHPLFGRHPRMAPLVSMSATPGVVKPGIVLGQHTDKVMRELGYSEDETRELEAQKIILRAQPELTRV